jgi:hypothetical protein
MRSFNKEILQFLSQKDYNKNIKIIHNFPVQKTINALFSFLSSTEKIIKENAILALAEIVSKLAENDIESARNIMRRLTWSLNEESGWIGWGSAEALGEIMARNKQLAQEYHKMLISYICKGENYLLFEELRKEVILGLKRLGKAHPDLIVEIKHLIN